ncbi:MAG: divergent PAP2 family protein [Lentisphaerae bacterium]|jgi:acid phosphatase family membrane protein YuiD|nr:divergent PAP2 family protein [Lentisphaerota bacterium]
MDFCNSFTLPIGLGWLANPSFWSAFLGWVMAQLTKMISFYTRTGKINLGYFVSTGGMPSAHSALCGGLITSIGIRVGTETPVFALALAFVMIVMFDAQSVRRAAGMQARILNQMLEELFTERKFSENKLAELLGHTPLEVFLGMLMGIFVALIVHSLPCWN